MKDKSLEKANAFKGINDIALKGEIVIYGSTYMAGFPFYELANRSVMEMAIYNRSIDGLTIDEAHELLNPCVIDIAPSKVFLHLGENEEIQKDSADRYKSIVRTIRHKLPNSTVYIISIEERDKQAAELNEQLRAFCNSKTVVFVDLRYSSGNVSAKYKTQFKKLSRFFRNRAIGFSEAFAISGV